jgi:predicted nuclease with TOPRIM domain
VPLGLWKSRWEIHREDVKRHREESERRSTEHREEMDRRSNDAERREAEHDEKMERLFADLREDRAAAEERWLQLGDRTGELLEKFDRELAETRRFNRQMLTQLEKTYFNLGTGLGLVGEQMGVMGEKLDLMGQRIEANAEEVKAQTDAIFRLLDHFKGPNGGPPT